MCIKQGKTNVLYLLIVLLVAVAVGGGIYYYINNQQIKQNPLSITQLPQDKTAGWKTYRNEEYGFAFKYPKNLICEETTSGINCAESDDYNEWKQEMDGCEEEHGFEMEDTLCFEIDTPFIIALDIISAEEFKREIANTNSYFPYELLGDPLLKFFVEKNYFNYYEDAKIFVDYPCYRSFGYQTGLGLHWFIHFVNKNPNLYIHYCATILEVIDEDTSDLDVQFRVTGYDNIARQMLSTLKFID